MVQYSNNLSLWGMHTEVLNNMSRWWRCPCIVSASWLIDARGGTDRVERGLTGVSGEIDTAAPPRVCTTSFSATCNVLRSIRILNVSCGHDLLADN